MLRDEGRTFERGSLLTPQEADAEGRGVAELLAVVDPTPLDDPRLPAEPLEGATAYRPAAPFELRRITGAHVVEGGRGLLLAVSGGTATVDGETRALAPAAAAWIDAAAPFEIDAAEAWLALELDTP